MYINFLSVEGNSTGCQKLIVLNSFNHIIAQLTSLHVHKFIFSYLDFFSHADMLLRCGILIKTKEPCSEVSDFTSVSFSVCLFVPFNFQAFLPPIYTTQYYISGQQKKWQENVLRKVGKRKRPRMKHLTREILNFLSKLRSFIFNVVASYVIISADLQLFVTL